jgi:tetratricopeptide (TPR) repeat protein
VVVSATDVRRRDSSSDDAARPRRDPHATVDAPVPEFPGYGIRGELGRGGMGVVYRAFDERRGEVVALKTLLWGDPAALYRFKQEFRGFADLSHRNLVSLHELVSDGRAWFFTMELVEGAPFLEWVREERERLRPALAQLLDGLAALHASGRVHRDVKPSNVLVAKDGRVVLLDFGLAAELAADGLHRSTKTHVLGTVAYMSPEQAMGRPVSSASDLYSVGVMLFEALTGRLPFEGDAVQMLVDKRTKEPPRAAAVASDVPADLDALCAELLSRDPSKRPTSDDVRVRLSASAAPAAARAAAEPSRTLVGRAPHLASLTRALDALARRRPVVALVHGASGMGKSALVQCFVDDVAVPRGAVVLSGRCYERESVPYKAVDSAMDALARHLARLPRLEAAALLPRDIATLTRLFPVLRRADAVASAPQTAVDIVDPAEIRRRAFAALRELLARISDRAPLVIWADDLQWGDTDSADLLTAVLRPPEAPALIFVGSYRREDAAASPFLSAALRTTEGFADRVEIAVDPLPEADAAALAARLVGGDAERAAAVAREARGSPFFVHELAEFGAETGGADVSLDDAIAARVARLDDDARTLLETVAVAGGPVSLDAAVHAAGVRSGERAAVAALRAGRLVRMKGAGADSHVDTYHDRVRETILARLPAETLRERHRRLGLSLEMTQSADPESLAVHFDGGGDAARAAHHYEAAAVAAVQSLAFGHAARLFAKAIDLGAHEGAARRTLLRRRADALAAGRRGAQAAQCYLEASEGAPFTEAADLRRRAAEEFLTSGRIDQGLEMAREALAGLGIHLARNRRVMLASILLRLAWFRVRGLGFRPRRPEDIDPEELERLDVMWALHSALSHVSPIVGLELALRHLQAALRCGESSRAQVAALYAQCIDTSLSLRHSIEQVIERTRAIRTSSDAPHAIAWSDFAVAFTAYHLGSWRTSVEYAETGSRAFRDTCAGKAADLNVATMYRMWALSYLGDLPTLGAAVREALADADERSDLFLAMAARTRLSYLLHLAAGDPDAALAEIRDALAEWNRPQVDLPRYWAFFARNEIALFRGDGDSVIDAMDAEARSFRRERHLDFPIIANEMSVVRARAALSAAFRRPPGSKRSRLLRTARSDARRLLRSRAPYAPLWGRLVEAGIAAVEGRDADAAAAYEASERELSASDTFLHAAAALRRRGELTGGDAGRALVAESERRMRERGIVNPARWADMYAPGVRP